ncbi:hypothetical protein J2783_004858 [Chryseobacterium sediminis]|jgi:hypothetical protein|nr:hypothetical protein [Chryseobacterium sediminis]
MSNQFKSSNTLISMATQYFLIDGKMKVKMVDLFKLDR